VGAGFLFEVAATDDAVMRPVWELGVVAPRPVEVRLEELAGLLELLG
jgi:hypothetical protein